MEGGYRFPFLGNYRLGLVLYQFKYFPVEATALSDLVNRYPLRQKGRDVGRIGVDSTLLTDDYGFITVQVL